MNNKHRTTCKDVLVAFREYLGRPKTVFDIKDRTRAFVIFALVVFILNKLAQMLFDL